MFIHAWHELCVCLGAYGEGNARMHDDHTEYANLVAMLAWRVFCTSALGVASALPCAPVRVNSSRCVPL